jgi:galactarate dehydratase
MHAIEKILAKASGRQTVRTGEIVMADVSFAEINDLYLQTVLSFWEMNGKKVWDKDRLAFVFDHYAPAPTIATAEIHKKMREFAQEQQLTYHFDINKGVCHQVMMERGVICPGDIIVATDSHTTTHGAMGAMGTGVVRSVTERIRRELLPKYPNVEGVVAITHAYGCGVAIRACEAGIPIRAIRNIIQHPNFGGEAIVVGLGCEKLTYDMVLPPEKINAETCITLQEQPGHAAMEQAILDLAEKKLRILNERRREELPLSELCIGMQCGGSDAFSGISANPSAGCAADMLVRGGATVLFSEITEVRDGVQLLAARCRDEETCRKLAREMAWYDRYLAEGGVDRDANPTPGNKKGGLANIVEKAMGSIAKSGSSPIEEVLSPAEQPHRHGLIFAATPGSDIVCGPSQAASGIGLQVFMTGRGTPYGLEICPVIKVCSRNELKAQWPDMIDLSAGDILTGERTIAQVGEELFRWILDAASGRRIPYSDQYGYHNDMCFFNPAPIT